MEEVLASATLARSDQLRSFLRYVCERTLSGNGKEINEYSVAFEALGKPPEFSPSEDSSVRRTAYELRQKLQKYYEVEQPQARVRIELPKGSDAPRFLEGVAPPPKGVPAGAGDRRLVRVLTRALAASILVAMALAVMVWRGSSRISPIVRDAWSPITASGDKVLISIGTTLHLVVRPYMTVVAGGLPKYPAPPELYPLFRQHRPLDEGVELSMHPVDNSVQLGHAETAAIAATTLTLKGASYHILPEGRDWGPALRGRCVVMISVQLNSNCGAV